MSDNTAAVLSCLLLIVVVLIAVAGVLVLVWYYRKKQEEKRVNLILALKDKLGEEMCQWLIRNKIKMNSYKTNAILDGFMRQGWDAETCKQLFAGRIAVGMTGAMVLSAYGRPNIVDEKEITAKYIRSIRTVHTGRIVIIGRIAVQHRVTEPALIFRTGLQRIVGCRNRDRCSICH